MDDIVIAKSPKDVREIPSILLPVEEPETVSPKYAPDGYDTPEEYLTDLREAYEQDVLSDEDNRKAAIEDKKFTAGEQWDPVVLQARQGLPCLTLNTIPQFTAQLVGDWRENKIAVKVLPAEAGDKNIADIRSDLIRSIETKSRADRAFDSAFESMVQCGDGAFRIGVQYMAEDVFDQDIAVSPIDDALSVVWDRLSIDPTGRDAKHCFVDDLLPRKEFEKQWPDVEITSLSTKESTQLLTQGWLDSNVVRVTEHWRMIERKRTLVMFTDGTIFAIDDLDIDDPDLHHHINDYIQKHGKPVRTRNAPCTYAQMHLVTGFKILAGPYEYKLSRLPIVRMSGRVVSIGEKRVRFGLVRFVKDNVRLRNFWRSVAAEQLGYAPKAQWLAPESAVEGREEAFRKAHLSRDPLLVYNDDATAPPERIDPPEMQAAILNEAQLNTQDMKDITGIHDASLGIKSNETSGRAIMARQREGDVASLTYYDNGNAAILEAGDVMNQLIPQIYDGTRIIRIIGEDEAAKMVTINDPNDPSSPNLATGRYDVAITTGASYTTRRVEAAEAMMDAIQVYPELMQVAGDLIVKAQDWPGAEDLSERLRKTIPPQLLSDKEKQEQGDQPDMQAIMQQQAQSQEQLQAAGEELQKLQQENLILKTKHDTEVQKLGIDGYKAETDRLIAYAALLKDDASMDLQRLEKEADVALEMLGHAHEAAQNDADREADAQSQMRDHAAQVVGNAQNNQAAADQQQAQIAAQPAPTPTSGDQD